MKRFSTTFVSPWNDVQNSWAALKTKKTSHYTDWFPLLAYYNPPYNWVRKFPYIKQPIRIFEHSADVCENLWSDSLTDPPKFYFQTTRERWNLFPQAVMEKHTHNETQMNHHEIYTYAIASLKLTWHLKITPWKRRLLLETIMFREYVSFGEGMYVYVCKMDVCIYM